MKTKFLIQEGDSDEYAILLYLGTKKRDKAKIKADEVLNDILNCISTTESSKMHADSPEFLKAIETLRKRIWKMIK